MFAEVRQGMQPVLQIASCRVTVLVQGLKGLVPRHGNTHGCFCSANEPAQECNSSQDV